MSEWITGIFEEDGWIKIETEGKEGKKAGWLEGIYVRSSYFLIVDLIWYGLFV